MLGGETGEASDDRSSSRYSIPISNITRSNTTRRLRSRRPRTCNQLIEAEGIHVVDHMAAQIGSYDVAIEIIGRDPEKWQPSTRETADHSFPIVSQRHCSTVVTLHSFGRKRLRDPALRS